MIGFNVVLKYTQMEEGFENSLFSCDFYFCFM